MTIFVTYSDYDKLMEKFENLPSTILDVTDVDGTRHEGEFAPSQEDLENYFIPQMTEKKNQLALMFLLYVDAFGRDTPSNKTNRRALSATLKKYITFVEKAPKIK